MEQIAGLGARLAEDVAELRGGLAAGPIVAETVDRALREFDRLGVRRERPVEIRQPVPAPIEPKTTGAS